MLDLHISSGQGLSIETPSGEVEVWAVDVRPQESQVDLELVVPAEWPIEGSSATYGLHQEFALDVPDGRIRIKVLRFRPRPDGTGGSVSLGIDAPRDWPILR